MSWRNACIEECVTSAVAGFACGESDSNGVAQIRMNNVGIDGALNFEKVRYVPKSAGKIERFLLADGDVLFNATNSANLVGKTALIANLPEPFVFSNHFIRLRVDLKKLEPSYLARWLTAQQRAGRFELMCNRWVNQASVRREDLLGLDMPLPPLLEQRRISAVLGKADALRAKRREAIAKLDRLLQSVFLEMFGDPISNPRKWPSCRLEELIKFTGGSQPPKEVFSDEPKPGYVRLVQIRDFRTDKYPTYIPEHLARRRFTKDDVMIGRYGPPVFQIFRGLEGSYNVALMKAQPRNGLLLDEYLFQLLKSDSIQASVIASSERSAGQSGVNLDFLHRIEVGLPSIELQQRFAQISKRLVAQRSLHVRSERQAEELFNSLQHRAFQGTL